MIIVEDGTGIPNANSYISVDDADFYATSFSKSDWSGTTDEKEMALKQATRAIDLLYGDKFISAKMTSTPLMFPRYPFYDNNQQFVSGVVPNCLKLATVEVAILYLTGQDILPQPADTGTQMSKIKIDTIEIQTDYKNGQKHGESFTGYYIIDLMLKPILKKTTSNWTLSR